MDIYGVKKNILELEQVFLDMTKVLVDSCVQEYTIDRTSVSLDMTKVSSVDMT